MLIGLGLTTTGCPNDTPYVPQEDAGIEEKTLTKFVIDLINNQTNDGPPASYDTFKDLPDPDGDSNNTGAYDALFR